MFSRVIHLLIFLHYSSKLESATMMATTNTFSLRLLLACLALQSSESFQHPAGGKCPEHATTIPKKIKPAAKQRLQRWEKQHSNIKVIENKYGKGRWSKIEAQAICRFAEQKAIDELAHSDISESFFQELIAKHHEVVSAYCKNRCVEDDGFSAVISLFLCCNHKGETTSVEQFRKEWCNIEEFRKRHSTVQNHWGEWSLVETRSFYLDMLHRGRQELINSGIPMFMWGRLASELRETLKEFCRNQAI